ncbi:MAG: anthranilate phosphoribosyltransferase [SAR202 cluster bacterium]|jgi:anthranilate phosphoribosyltransferase|nr:anthranilate phosphoribosyltransferase [SAR202 cluster bacterium]MDP6713205.1 anthranilate phosphoribosyltransferase [SAR202 cluster bacterium]
MIREAIDALVEGNSLTMDEAAAAMNEIMDGEATPAQFGAYVTALRLKGETVEEIAGMARVMREKALQVSASGVLVDTAGTGGDRSGSFNISTTAALVAAGAGAQVAKHGNRAMSGATGSADVLEALGVKIDLSPDGVQRCIEEVGFGFMFAQRYHPSMRFAAGPRREIGIRNVFNILGPLTNPAGAKRQVIGVADPAMARRMAEVLGALGSERALVVHGEDGMDEFTITGPSQVWELNDGSVTEYQFTPDSVGLPTADADALAATSADNSAEIARSVLGGASGPARDVVLLNAAAALVVAGQSDSLSKGVIQAGESIDSGAASRALSALAELSQTLE